MASIFTGVQVGLSRDIRLTVADLADLNPDQICDLFGALDTIATLAEVAKRRVTAGRAARPAPRQRALWQGYACMACFHAAHQSTCISGCPCRH